MMRYHISTSTFADHRSLSLVTYRNAFEKITIPIHIHHIMDEQKMSRSRLRTSHSIFITFPNLAWR